MFSNYNMEKLLRDSARFMVQADSITEEKVLMKNGNEKEVIRSVTKEVGVASSVTYDLTLVCKGGATVIKIIFGIK